MYAPRIRRRLGESWRKSFNPSRNMGNPAHFCYGIVTARSIREIRPFSKGEPISERKPNGNSPTLSIAPSVSKKPDSRKTSEDQHQPDAQGLAR